MSDAIVHIAGARMIVCGRVIQRCSVCGAKLCDSEGVMMPVGPDGKPPVFPTFPENRLIEVSAGQPTRHLVLPDTDRYPENGCVELA